MSPGTIGVVTVTYNSGRVLEDFLKSLRLQKDVAFVLYAVDNASSDDSLAMLEAAQPYPVRIIANPSNVGVAEANNQGIRAAMADGCESILLINNDTVFGADLLTGLHHELVARNCAMAAPKIYYYDVPTKIWSAGGYFEVWLGRSGHFGDGVIDNGQFDRPRLITYVPTTCVLIRRSVFERIGLLDPIYFLYWEDTDFMYRAMRAGLQLWYVPHVSLWHKVSSLTGGIANPAIIRYGVRNRVYFVRKHFNSAVAGIWLLAYRTYLFLLFVFGKDTREQREWKMEAFHEGKQLPVSS